MHILVTTDGSKNSLAALGAAGPLTKAAGASLTLVRILDPRLDCGDAFAPTLAEAVELTRSRWQAELENALSASGYAGACSVVIKERNENVASAILRTATEQEADLIAMTTRGSGRLHRALLGSVSLDVLGRSGLPVLVAGPRFAPKEVGSVYRLVVTTDGSPGSLAAMRELGQRLALPGIAITLLRVCWPGDIDSEDEAQLQEIAASLTAATQVSVVVREMALIDGAAQGILDIGQELAADALAMATEGHRGAYHVFSGSVSLSVVSRSTVPVVLSKRAS
jgi:nucleotide-binding universal stress UspA family protein